MDRIFRMDFKELELDFCAFKQLDDERQRKILDMLIELNNTKVELIEQLEKYYNNELRIMNETLKHFIELKGDNNG